MIIYHDVKRRKSQGPKRSCLQTTSKAGLDLRKVFCTGGILKGWFTASCFQKTKPSMLLNTVSNLSVCQRMWARSVQNLANGRSITQHDNVLSTCQKLLELSWDVLPYPPYSADLTPSDYHLFCSLQTSFNRKTFSDIDAIKIHLFFF